MRDEACAFVRCEFFEDVAEASPGGFHSWGALPAAKRLDLGASLLDRALIVRDLTHEPDRQQIVLLLGDFAFKTPEEIYAGGGGGTAASVGHAMGQMPMASGNHAQGTAMPAMAAKPTVKNARGGNAKSGAMMMDLNDVARGAFLANDRTLDDPQIVRVERAGRVLLRVIDASAASNCQIVFGKMVARLIAVDGYGVQSIAGSVFQSASRSGWT